MSEPVSIATVEARVAPKTQDLADAVSSLVVDSTESEQRASDLLGVVTTGIKEITEECEPACKAAYRAHKEMVAHRDRLLKPWGDARDRLRKILGDYQAQVRAEQEKERLRLEEEARKRHDEQVQSMALEMERKGLVEAASAALEEALSAPLMVAPPPPPPKASGVSYREEWDFEVQDVGYLRAPFLLPNEPAIRAIVRAVGPEAVKQVSTLTGEGIRVFKKTVVASRKP